VTDAGLKELSDLKQLTFLQLGETKVTAAGVKELQAALPHCQIQAPGPKADDASGAAAKAADPVRDEQGAAAAAEAKAVEAVEKTRRQGHAATTSCRASR